MSNFITPRAPINIVCWSPFTGACGVTSTTVVLSEIFSLLQSSPVTIRSNHFHQTTVESYFENLNRYMDKDIFESFYVSPDYPNYQGYLFDYQLTIQKIADSIPYCRKSFQNLSLLPPVESSEEPPFPRPDNGTFPSINFMDSSGQNSLYSFKCLEEASVILVFLPNTPDSAYDFLSNYKSLRKKCFYIFNRFDESEKKRLCRFMSELGIEKKHFDTIPYSSEFENACFEKKLDTMILKAYSGAKYSSYYTRLKRIATKITAFAAECQSRYEY